MHIEITRTSKRFHLPPDIAQAFIEAGLATEVPNERTAPAIRGPRWVVNSHPMLGTPRIVFTGATGQVIEYPGPHAMNPAREEAAAAFAAMGWPVPENILDEFDQQLAAHKADAKARFYANANLDRTQYHDR